MAFNMKEFSNQRFESRTEAVPVPELSQFFGEDEKPVWVVRMLTGPEIGYCKMSANTDKAIQATLGLLASEKVSDKVDGMAKLLELGVKRERAGDIPERLHHLTTASVEPECTIDMAVKLAKTFPITFYTLTNKILQLSGQGMSAKVAEKKQPSS